MFVSFYFKFFRLYSVVSINKPCHESWQTMAFFHFIAFRIIKLLYWSKKTKYIECLRLVDHLITIKCMSKEIHVIYFVFLTHQTKTTTKKHK